LYKEISQPSLIQFLSARDNMIPEPALLLIQWSIGVVYLMNARFGFAMAVAVVIK
jgi:hypothetical protein